MAKMKTFEVVVRETTIMTKERTESIQATSLEDAQQRADNKFAHEMRNDGMGSSYGTEVVSVE